MTSKKIPGTIEAWESGALGATEKHALPAHDDMQSAIDEALGLQAISIRIPKLTIETYKALAKIHGVGYQPLMRDVLSRWADSEVKQMLIASQADKQQEKSHAKVRKSGAADRTNDDHPAAMRKVA